MFRSFLRLTPLACVDAYYETALGQPTSILTVMRPQFTWRSQTLQAGRSLRSRVGFNGIVNIRPSTVCNFEGWQAIRTIAGKVQHRPFCGQVSSWVGVCPLMKCGRGREIPPSTFTSLTALSPRDRDISMRTPVSPITTSFSHFLKNLVIPRSAARSPLSVMRGRAHASITTSGSRQLAYLVENVTAYNTPPERITELVNMTTMSI